MDHLGSGKEWDLNRKRDGLFFLPLPFPMMSTSGLEFVSAICGASRLFSRSTQQYAAVANSYTVGHIPFQQVLKQHLESGRDLTEVCHEGKPLGWDISEQKSVVGDG